MVDTIPFAGLLLLVSLAAMVAILSNRLSTFARIPAPLFFLAGAAVAVAVESRLRTPTERTVERIVIVCLICILFEGGMSIGRERFRSAAAPILSVGVAGTFLTTAAIGLLAHVGFGFSWYVALLLGSVIAPTDPAVVFSVLGQREIAGRAGTILEGESGANDPVGIALVASLLSAGKLDTSSLSHVTGQFALQMGVGAAGGIAGGLVLLWFMRRVALPNEGLYPLRTLAFAFALYGIVAVLHGSGFLAVFIAGIVVGGERAPFKREIERFHSAIASLAEITAFVVLGMTVNLRELVKLDVWLPGAILAVTLGVLIRPLLVGLCLWPARLRRNHAAFVLFAGLKGAVPLLLGTMLLTAHLTNPNRLYGIVVVVVLSVLIQGGLVPAAAKALRVPMRVVEPQPWALGVRLAEEPDDVLHVVVEAGSAATGRTVQEIAELTADPGAFWVNLLVRDRRLASVRGDTRVEVGDEIVISSHAGVHEEIERLFAASGTTGLTDQ